jgi:DNA-binding transcriptional LysR family regulator
VNCVKFIIVYIAMYFMNQFLATLPFDLYELTLFQLVAESGSFTRAAEKAGLTQSAITRQIRGMEDRLEVALFERTTRRVCLTRAGQLLQEKSKTILDASNELLSEVQRMLGKMPPTLRVGVARSIGLAYFPGYFFAFQRRHPEVQLQVTHQTSREILASLEAGSLDAGLICPPPRLPPSLKVTHRFADEFTTIAPPQFPLKSDTASLTIKQLKKILAAQRWLLMDRQGFTGRKFTHWLRKQDWLIEPAMELDSFDVIVALVSLGLGVSMVPHRVLALYSQRRVVRRIPTHPRFSRELAVVVRRNRITPEPLRSFVENILF